MANELIKKVKETIEKEDLIVAGDHIILALSGGPDSVALLHALLNISNEIGFNLSAVHINHGLRGKDSDADSEYVKTLCGEKQIPVTLFNIDVNKLAEDIGLTLEEAGRRARYNAFDEVANKIELDEGISRENIKIATAHNMNDQLETIFMRIIRGTGPAGLAGIPVRRIDEEGYEIVRPLLDTDRDTIEEFLKIEGIHPQIDKTNEDTKYFRNKIRHNLMPILKDEFGVSALDSILRLSIIATEEKDYFDAVIGETIENNCEFEESVHFGGDSALISLELMQGVHPAIRHKLITGIFSEIGLNQDIAAVHLAAAEDLILQGKTGKTINFPRGYTLEIRYEKVIFKTVATTEEDDTLLDDEGAEEAITTEFDADALKNVGITPEWRTRLPGDKIRPEGMNGTKKLQDLFVDMKISRDVRDRILILAVGDNVLWVPGLRKSRDFAVTECTKNVAKYQSRQKLF